MKSEPKRSETEKALASSREAAEAAIAAAKNAGISTWENSARKIGGSISQWEDVSSEESTPKKAA